MKKHENPAEANVRRDFFFAAADFSMRFSLGRRFGGKKVRRAKARLRMSKINRTSF